MTQQSRTVEACREYEHLASSKHVILLVQVGQGANNTLPYAGCEQILLARVKEKESPALTRLPGRTSDGHSSQVLRPDSFATRESSTFCRDSTRAQGLDFFDKMSIEWWCVEDKADHVDGKQISGLK